jgi:hypothetical protein
MLGGRPWSEWIAQYSHSHQHPVNRFCHTLGIPLIALSIPLGLLALLVDDFWRFPLAMFVVGWTLSSWAMPSRESHPSSSGTGASSSWG